MSSAKEFVAFWLEVSVHADEPIKLPNTVDGLVQRLVFAANNQGITLEQLQAQYGGLLKW